jgi:hypothetical protein
VVAIAAERCGDAVIIELSNATVLERLSKAGPSDQSTTLTAVNRVSPSKMTTWQSDGKFIYALYPRMKLVAYPLSGMELGATGKVLWERPGATGREGAMDPGVTIESFTVTEPGESFVGFASDRVDDRSPRLPVLIERSGGRTTTRAEEVEEPSAPSLDAKTHCALREKGANLTGIIQCVRAGEKAFVAVPFHGWSMEHLTHDGRTLVWRESQGALYAKSF